MEDEGCKSSAAIHDAFSRALDELVGPGTQRERLIRALKILNAELTPEDIAYVEKVHAENQKASEGGQC